MDNAPNVMNAGFPIERSGLPFVGNAANDESVPRRPRGGRCIERRASRAAAAPVRRLVLVSGSGRSNAALEMRARLLARDMHVGPAVVRFRREDDVAAMTSASDLILVGRKQPVPFIVPYLGRAERRVLRKSRAPMLVVAGEPRAAYSRVLVATDLETDVSDALAIAKRIAPNASFTLLHFYRALFDGKLQWGGVPETDIAEYRVDAQREAALGMAALIERQRTLDPARTLLRYGWPVPGILRTSAEIDADLLVVVRNSRSRWADALGASVSLELAQRADRDVLVVHAPDT